MLRLSLISLALCAPLLAASAWAQEKPVLSPGFSDPKAAAQFHVLAGEMAAQRQQPLDAARELIKAYDLVKDPALAQRAALLALAGKDDTLTLAAAMRWLQADPNELEPREILLPVHLRLAQPAKAREQAAAIVQGHAGGEADGFRHVALLLAQDKTLETAALALMQSLQKQWPKLPGALYAQGLLAMRFARYEEAEIAARGALKLEEDFQDARLLLLGAQVKRGRLQDADVSIEQLIASGQNEVELRLGYVRLLADAKHSEAAGAQLRQVLALEADNEDAHFALAMLALDARDFETAETHLTRLLESEQRAQDAYFYLGSLAHAQRRWEQALEWYGKVTQGDKALDALLRQASMMARLKRVKEARELLDSLREQAPMLATRVATEEAHLLLDANQPGEALAVLDRSLKQSPAETDLLFSRALALERLNRFDKAEEDLRRILKDAPDDGRALNALGFLLTVHTQRFDEARKLILRALEQTPDDAAVIDSYGWVQFRMGQTQEARATLEKAYGKLKDPEIAAHLGEVLWMLGERDRAREVWNSALGDDPDHRVLKETIQRLAP